MKKHSVSLVALQITLPLTIIACMFAVIAAVDALNHNKRIAERARLDRNFYQTKQHVRDIIIRGNDLRRLSVHGTNQIQRPYTLQQLRDDLVTLGVFEKKEKVGE